MNETKETSEATRAKRTRASRTIARPPETAAGDIDQLFERIRTIAAPAELSGSWAKGFGLAPDSAKVLKWLGLVKDGKVDVSLWDEVRVPATRKAALTRLVQTAYAPILDQVDIAEASKEVLAGAFITKYKMGDPIRYVRAFVTLCRHAGIDVGADEAKPGEAKPAAMRAGRQSTLGRKPEPTPKPKRTRPETSAGGRAANQESEAGKPTIGVNIEIPANWTEEEVRARIAAVKRALAEAGEA